MQEALAARFERMVDRTCEHHIWTGATKAGRGTGRIQVDGRNTTAHRLAWETRYGPVSARAPRGESAGARRLHKTVHELRDAEEDAEASPHS